MQFASVQDGNRERWGVIEGDTVYLAPVGPGWPESLLGVIRRGLAAALESGASLGNGEGEARALEDAALLAPVPRPPRNIICLGLNYAEHARESQATKGQPVELPEHPVVFTKATSSVTGPRADIPLDPAVTTQLDWEVELAVVIGRGGRHIAPEDAMEHVLGYTVINDLSARDLQFRHKQFFLGKSLDGACPMGPAIVTRDAIPDPHDLALWCDVNGERQQHGHTSDQIFRINETIARLSTIMTLEPGDILSTGTPSGVGFAQEPPRFLAPGDRVECGVEGIGTLRNRIVAATGGR